MFEKIRKPGRAKNIVSYVVFGLICLVFVFIGVPLNKASNVGGGALIVNNKVISWSEYRSYLQMLEQQPQGPLEMGLEAKRQEQLRKKAVEALLNIELMVQGAQRSGVTVAERAVRDKVVAIPSFQEEGRFMYSKYRSFLDARKFSSSYFENLIGREIQTARFQNLFNLTVHTSEKEKEKKQKLNSFEVQVSYVQFSVNELDVGELNNISTMVQSGQLDLLNQIIEDKKWDWEKIDSFNLNRVSLPNFGSQKILFDAVLDHLPNTGVIKQIINVRDKSFILKVDSFNSQKEENTPSSFPDYFFTDMMASRMVFLLWIRSARSSAKLKFNPKLQSVLQ